MKTYLIMLVSFILGLCYAPALHAQIITTFAGNGLYGNMGDDGPATNAEIKLPSGLAVDILGNIYFADLAYNCIRKVNTSGIITTIAGNDSAGGYSGDGGPATAASLKAPWAITVDLSGNVYVVDAGNNCIREINTSGMITTVAGIPLMPGGYNGDGGPATVEKLNFPVAVAVDRAGNLYIADFSNNSIRKVSASIMTTIAGNRTGGYRGDGGPATAAELYQPYAVAVDSLSNVYVVDNENLVRRVNTSGIITTIAGNTINGYSGDGGPATAAYFFGINGIAVDQWGNIFLSDGGNNVIRGIHTSGIVTTYTGNDTMGYRGDGGPANLAELNLPWGIAIDMAGDLFIADEDNYRIRRVSPSPSSVPGLNLAAGDIKIYPNPATDKLYVSGLKESAAYRLLSLAGNCVIMGIFGPGNNTISLQSLSAGIYILEITGSNGQKTIKKIMKQ